LTFLGDRRRASGLIVARLLERDAESRQLGALARARAAILAVWC
jgi:hypothetical protein